jgi:ATP-binding cassette, subfamily A (ABC1), member 3
LTMYEGQIFVLLGHNGAGKTTTASMITGLLPPTSGSISVYGRNVPEDLDDVRYDIGMGVCPQHDVLYHDLTVEEHLKLFAGIKGVPSKDVNQAVQETIATVGLTEKVKALASSLSGGMKRKLSVGIALIGGSKVVILDEPTSGMDPYSRRSTWQMLKVCVFGSEQGRLCARSGQGPLLCEFCFPERPRGSYHDLDNSFHG